MRFFDMVTMQRSISASGFRKNKATDGMTCRPGAGEEGSTRVAMDEVERSRALRRCGWALVTGRTRNGGAPRFRI